MQPVVIYEDNHLIAVNKPSGWLVHGDSTGDRTLADFTKKYIKHRYDKPGDVFLGVIHRIDRPVSGVVVFARTSKALERMNRLFQERKVEKTYLAITKNRPEPIEAELVHYLAKDKSRNVTRVYETMSKKASSLDAKQARLSYTVIGHHSGQSLIKVKPLTGRPHQIRAQLSAVGAPILGDVKYESSFALSDASIALHAYALSFVHPVKKEPVIISADPPSNELWNSFKGIW